MVKTGRNDPCPCGSGKKYKKCCLGKKPREHIIMVGSPEPLRGVHYDKAKMEFQGLTHDGRLIKPDVTFSQTHYKGQSGKEKVITRIQDKVIPHEGDLMRYLSSSFDLIVAVDTNTKVISGEALSVTGVVYCVVKPAPDPDSYTVEFPWHGAVIFRNCPKEASPEKFGWKAVIEAINKDQRNISRRFALVTDHDLDHHISLNSRKMPAVGGFYIPSNFALIYGRGDGPKQSILNYLVRECDRQSTSLLKEIEEKGYYQLGERKLFISEIPVPRL
jgi:hypothetical protein